MTANIRYVALCSFVYVIGAIVSASPISKLPKGFIQCKLSDPNFEVCLKNALQSSIPVVARGIPSLNIIKIDPLRIRELEIDQGTGPVNINLKFKELDIINLQHLIVNKIHYNPENYSISYELHAPKPIVLQGDYDVSGKILFLPIVGNGKCKINIEVLKYVGNVINKLVVKNGEKYLEIEKISWKMIPIKMKLKLDNLFNGDKALGDNMNAFLNENWREIFTELQPAIEEVFGGVMKEIGQQFFSRIPLNQIFLQ